MRARTVAPWLTCGLVLTGVCAAWDASAQKAPEKKRPDTQPITSCIDYDQDVRDDGIELSLVNTCDVDVDCAMSWTLRCDGAKPKRKTAALIMARGESASAFASAEACGEEGWRVTSVTWGCRGQDD